MPEDELVFGWQYPLPQDLTVGRVYQNTPENYMWSMTLQGNAKLHLYGSIIKDKKEYHDPRNQNLTSNAVHEPVGSEPLIDQFQIDQRTDHVNTYLDRVVDASTAKFVGGFLLVLCLQCYVQKQQGG